MIIAHKTRNRQFELRDDFFYFSYVWFQCSALNWSRTQSLFRWNEHFFVLRSPLLSVVNTWIVLLNHTENVRTHVVVKLFVFAQSCINHIKSEFSFFHSRRSTPFSLSFVVNTPTKRSFPNANLQQDVNMLSLWLASWMNFYLQGG